MQSAIQSKLQKIQKISNVLRVACKVLFVLIGLQFLAVTIMLLSGRDGTLNYSDGAFWLGGLTFHFRLVLLGVSAMTSALMVKFVFHLQRLFSSYSHGEIFTQEAVGQLHQLGVTYLLWGAMEMLWTLLPHSIVAQALSSSHSPHYYNLNTESFSIGIVLLLVAWFMDMAVEMREENELTI